MRSLRLDQDTCPGLHNKLRRLYHALPLNTIFLPNLLSLMVITLEGLKAKYIRWLLSPRLRDIFIGHSAAAGGSILHLLPDVCPDIRDLVSWHWPSPAHDLVGKLNRLRVFNICLPGQILPSITRTQVETSKSITSLYLRNPIYLGSWTFDPAASFSLLRSLIIDDIMDVLPVARFLSQFSSKSVGFLQVLFDPRVVDVPRSVINEIISVIGEFRSLSYLTLGHHTGRLYEHSDTRPGLNIDPLLRLHSLKAMDLCIEGLECVLNDEGIAKFTKAWPLLQRFTFSQSESFRMKPVGLTLGCLASFALHCPLLMSLDLELDATLVPEQASPARIEGRIDLCFDGSLISRTSWAKAATYISGVYPHAQIKMENWWDKLRADEMELWERVVELVPVISLARAEERVRVLKQA